MRILPLLLAVLIGLAQPIFGETLHLKNGAELLVEHDPRSPRDTVMISFLGGSGLLKATEQGINPVLSQILEEGPEGMSTEEYKKQLFLLGGQVGFWIAPRRAGFSVVAPEANLDKVMDLALATLKKPKFDPQTFQIAMAKVGAMVAQQEDNMASILRYYAMRDAFANHPDVLDGNTSRASLKNVTLEKVKAAVPQLYDARYLMAAAVGPSAGSSFQKIIDSRLEQAGYLSAPVQTRSFVSARKDQNAKGPVKIVLLNRPGATDNQLRYIVRRNFPVDNADFVALDLANRLLGDGMQGALFRVLREERGLTYSAGSGLNEDLGALAVVSFASTDKLPKLMQGIDEVVSKQAAVVVDKASADLIKGDSLTKWKEARELPADRLSELVDARIYGRDVKFLQTQDQWISRATEADITRMGQKYLSLKGAYIYLMGDKTKLLPVLKTLGYKGKDVKVVEPESIL